MARLVYHYTSLDALRGILGENVCLWATKYNHLNDPSEQIWAENLVLKSIKEQNGYSDEDFAEIKDFLDKKSYILSLSKKRDDRNMWRLYCNDGKGVCLVLDRDILTKQAYRMTCENPSDTFCILEDVEYASRKTIKEAVSKCYKKESFHLADEEDANKQMKVIPFIKNDDFRIESEVRCAILKEVDRKTYHYDPITDSPRKGEIHRNTTGVKFRMRGNDLIPYMDVLFPVKALKGLILGYEVNEHNAKAYINSLIYPYKSLYKNIFINISSLFSSQIKDYQKNDNNNK